MSAKELFGIVLVTTPIAMFLVLAVVGSSLFV